MREKKQRAECIMYVIATFLTAAGTALCLAGLLLPNWFYVEILDGKVAVTSAHLGLWQDEVCGLNTTCQTYWFTDGDYTRHANLTLPSWKLIQGIETAGTAVAVLSLLSLVPLWICYSSRHASYRLLTFSFFFMSSMISGFLCIIGCLIISSKGTSNNMDFAPLLSGIGGTTTFISVCMSCAICRYDPTYGTLENPVSPRFSRA